MDAEEERLLKKIRTRNNVIFKYGTYTMVDPDNNNSADTYSSDSSLDVSETAVSEEDAKIAEIMNKFSSNIQNNVNSLFDNI